MKNKYEITLKLDGDFIEIAPNIKVKVMQKQFYGDVRIGIEAPDDISILREEIYQRITGDKK